MFHKPNVNCFHIDICQSISNEYLPFDIDMPFWTSLKRGERILKKYFIFYYGNSIFIEIMKICIHFSIVFWSFFYTGVNCEIAIIFTIDRAKKRRRKKGKIREDADIDRHSVSVQSKLDLFPLAMWENKSEHAKKRRFVLQREHEMSLSDWPIFNLYFEKQLAVPLVYQKLSIRPQWCIWGEKLIVKAFQKNSIS